jgi:hypothetical protein
MRVIIQTTRKRIERVLKFDGTVSDLVDRLNPRLNETLFSDKGRELYTVLVDGMRAGPDSAVGETVSILPVITGG